MKVRVQFLVYSFRNRIVWNIFIQMRSINKKIREVETKYILAFVYYFTSQYKKKIIIY
jgi:hypothetical protein